MLYGGRLSKEAASWNRYGDNEGHVYGSINEVLMAYETNQIHMHSRVAIPAKALHKTNFSEAQQNNVIDNRRKIIFATTCSRRLPILK